MLAVFGKVASSGQEIVQGLRLNTGEELLMKPLKQQAAMTMLDLAASPTNGDRTLPLARQGL
jgi:hypothetical protein